MLIIGHDKPDRSEDAAPMASIVVVAVIALGLVYIMLRVYVL
jgi:hypothetical protein